MSSVAEVSLWFLWLLVVVLYLLVLLLYRQWGLSLVRPSERFSRHGLDIGARVPSLRDLYLAADSFALAADEGWAAPKGAALAVFMIPNCPVCVDLKKELAQIEPAKLWPESRFVMIEKVDVSDTPRVDRNNGVLHIRLHDADRELFTRFDIQRAPFAYVISPDDRVKAKGLVNTVEALNALLDGSEGHIHDQEGVHQHDDA